jgi:hypothetical protein
MFVQHRHELVDLLVERLRPGERARVQPLRHGGAYAVSGQRHPRVAPASDPAQIAVVAHAKRGTRGGELARAVAAELVAAVGRKLRELGGYHLSLLPEGAGDERDRRVGLGRVARDRAAGGERLVVGVGVHEQQPPPGRGWHHDRTLRACCGWDRTAHATLL